MKFLALAVATLAFSAVALSAPTVDDNQLETENELTPVQKLLGIFNSFDKDLKDIVLIVDLINDLVGLTKGYERTCVLEKLRITEDDPNLSIEDMSEKEAMQVAAAIAMCLPDTENKIVELFVKIQPLIKKYGSEIVEKDQLECAQQLLMELDAGSPLLSEEVKYGFCSVEQMEVARERFTDADNMLKVINEEVDEDCPLIDNSKKFRINMVKLFLTIMGNNSNEIREAELRRLYKSGLNRIDRYLKCSMSDN